MKKLYIAILAGAAPMIAGSAAAADLGPGPVYETPTVAPIPNFSWTGPYGGLFAGYGVEPKSGDIHRLQATHRYAPARK